MKLYCTACDTAEVFTPGEVERIVYALVAMEADERCATTPRLGAGRDPMLNTSCLKNVLGYSRDSEMYAEHTSATIEARRRADRAELARRAHRPQAPHRGGAGTGSAAPFSHGGHGARS